MTIRLSTGLRKALLGDIVILGSAATYTLVNGGASAKTMTSSASDFITKGFHIGQILTLAGCTTAGNDGATAAITAVAAGTLSFDVGDWTQAEALPAAATGTANDSGSFGDVFAGGVLRIYTGSQPSTADAAETGDLLLEISLASGAFVPAVGSGNSTNGLLFQMMADDAGRTETVLSKKASETWSGLSLTGGQAGWARLYDKRRQTGASYTSRRMDMNVATSGTEMVLPVLTIVADKTTTVDTFDITLRY
jgi:hypothetical protein